MIGIGFDDVTAPDGVDVSTWVFKSMKESGDVGDCYDRARSGEESVVGSRDCAIAHKACRDNRSVLYVRFTRLLDELALARGDGRIASRLESLARAF